MTMMTDEEHIETLPLTTRFSFRSQSATPPISHVLKQQQSSLLLLAAADDSSAALVRQAVVVLAFCLASWYGPRYVLDSEVGIAQRTVPFQTTTAGDVILDSELNKPLIDPPTVPSEVLVWTSVGLPLLLVTVVSWCTAASQLHRVHLLHASVCGLWTALALSEGPTQLLKLYIQRRRPNFYALCAFDVTVQRCLGSLHSVREANLSFPSGHSSLSCCASTFLVYFFVARILAMPINRTTKRAWILLVSLLLYGWTVFVAASRLVDYWHHCADVVAGLWLGFVAATVAYHVWFAPWWMHSSLPYSLTSTELTKLPSFSD